MGSAVHNSESYAHCLLMTFQTEVDMHAYEGPPAHIAVGKKSITSFKTWLRVDYWSKA